MTTPATGPAVSHDPLQHQYVPVLLTRRGERIALRGTSPAIKARMTPLFVVPPVAWNYDREQPDKTVAAHIADLPAALAADWGTAGAYVDTIYLPDDLIDGAHPVEVICAGAAADGLPLTPVTGPDRSAAHHQAVARLVASAPANGVCLRLRRADALNVIGPVHTRAWSLHTLLTTLGVSEADTDLVLDFGEEVDDPVATATLAWALLAGLPNITSWRTVTVVGTSIPASLAGVPTMAVTAFDRPEWEAYLSLLSGSSLPRVPRFGDYGVQHPDLPDIDPRFMRIFSQFRYAVGNRWLIARGEELRKAGYGHVRDLAQLVTARPEYAGATYSPGDEWLAHCARGAGTTGSPEVWRRVGTSHHLVHVVRELAAAYGTTAP